MKINNGYPLQFSGDSDQAKANRLYFAALDPAPQASGSTGNGDAFTEATEAVENAQAWDYQTLGEDYP